MNLPDGPNQYCAKDYADNSRYAYLLGQGKEDGRDTCDALTGDVVAGRSFLTYSEVKDKNNKEYGTAVLLEGSEKVLVKGNFKLGLELNVLCDHDVPADEVKELTWFKSYHGVENITMKSSSGCPAFSTNRMFIVLNSIRYVIAPLFIIAGGFLLVKGRERIHISVAISCFTFISFAVLFALYHVMFFNNRQAYFDWILCVPTTIGSAFGAYYISQRKLRFGVYVMSATATIIAALMVMTMVQLPILLIVYAVVLLAAGVGFFVGLKRPHFMMIFSTSLLGSYFIVRGICSFILYSVFNMVNEFA